MSYTLAARRGTFATDTEVRMKQHRLSKHLPASKRRLFARPPLAACMYVGVELFV